MATTEVKPGKFVDLPVVMVVMQGQQTNDYVTVFNKISDIVYNHTDKKIDSGLFVSDAQADISKALSLVLMTIYENRNAVLFTKI